MARKTDRLKNDAYSTPEALARRIVETMVPDGTTTVFEPHVGEGPFVRALQARSGLTVCGLDIDPAVSGLQLLGPQRGFVGDFLRIPVEWNEQFDMVVGNCPYARPDVDAAGNPTGRVSPRTGKLIMVDAVEAHTRRAVDFAKFGVVYLLRCGILSRKWVWDLPIQMIGHIDPRPKFTATGSDASEYVAIRWVKGWDWRRDGCQSFRLEWEGN